MDKRILAEALRRAREAAHVNLQTGELLDHLLESPEEAFREAVEAFKVASAPDAPETAAQAPEPAAVPEVPAMEPRPVEGRLTTGIVRVPSEIDRCTGIVVHGKRFKSFAYSTDVAVIRNTNADAILAVYPFTGHPSITQAILSVAKAPVFTGVGGGTTTGHRVLELAMFAEMQGVQGVVLNAPSPVETVGFVAASVDVPVVATILTWDDVARAKVEAGAHIVNVAAGRETASVVRALRVECPDLPVIATGGHSPETILETIAAGANAISWTPPNAQDLQGEMMDAYRAGEVVHGHASAADGQSDPADEDGDAAATVAAAAAAARADFKLSSWLAEKGM